MSKNDLITGNGYVGTHVTRESLGYRMWNWTAKIKLNIHKLYETVGVTGALHKAASSFERTE